MKGLILMKKRRLLRRLLCGIVLLGSIGGFLTAAYAQSTSFEFTITNVAGVESGNCNTPLAEKTDTDQYFVVKLSMMTQSPYVKFSAFNSENEMVSYALTIQSTELLSYKSHDYDIMTALNGASYYLSTAIPRGYSNAYISGTFWP